MVTYLTQQQASRIEGRFRRLYGPRAAGLMDRFFMLLGRYGVGVGPIENMPLWDENDTVLITYADSIRQEGERPLVTLRRFCAEYLKGTIRTVHILPFYPWSSDDGFSVIDYRKVEPSYGHWDDVENLGKDFNLMFDLVLNHCSRKSAWFREFVTGVAPGRHYFHSMDPSLDLSKVVRPRQSPLLTQTATRNGSAWVWTTFSDDQVDLNWANPDVLFEFLDIFFLYLSKGCRVFRLDAVAFLWKSIGTDCLHLPETHEVVKLFRDVLEVVAPASILITETNVPHEENISYFGDGDEAHMVYNFTLPPLLLHGLLRGSAVELTRWAAGLPNLPPGRTFFNFTASHDGVGVRPLQGILPDSERDWLAKEVTRRGGKVSLKSNSDGSTSPYELNISYVDALGDRKNEHLGTRRFLCSQAVALSLRGVPALYIHSLMGTGNDLNGLKRLGYNRAINRRKLDIGELTSTLADLDSRENRIHTTLIKWIRRRGHHPAFHPDAPQEVMDLGPEVFALRRTSLDGAETIFCLFNFTATEQLLPFRKIDACLGVSGTCRDLISAQTLRTGPKRSLTLSAYQAVWLVYRR